MGAVAGMELVREDEVEKKEGEGGRGMGSSWMELLPNLVLSSAV